MKALVSFVLKTNSARQVNSQNASHHTSALNSRSHCPKRRESAQLDYKAPLFWLHLLFTYLTQ